MFPSLQAVMIMTSYKKLRDFPTTILGVNESCYIPHIDCYTNSTTLHYTYTNLLMYTTCIYPSQSSSHQFRWSHWAPAQTRDLGG